MALKTVSMVNTHQDSISPYYKFMHKATRKKSSRLFRFLGHFVLPLLANEIQSVYHKSIRCRVLTSHLFCTTCSMFTNPHVSFYSQLVHLITPCQMSQDWINIWIVEGLTEDLHVPDLLCVNLLGPG